MARDALVEKAGGHVARLVNILSHKAEPPAGGQVGVEGDAGRTLRRPGGDPAFHGGVVDGTDREALRPVSPHVLQQPEGFLRQVGFAPAEQDADVGLLQLGAGPADAPVHLGAKLSLPIGEKNPQRKGPCRHAGLPSAGQGDIAGLPYRLQHSLPDLFIYMGAVVQNAVHGAPGPPPRSATI